MGYQYVVIEREYGSGGTEIARKLAQECGISCYGREIMEAVAKRYQVSPDVIERYEESVSNSFLYTIYAISQVQGGRSDMLTGEGQLFLAEQEEIRNFAIVGPAVFLGHCAEEALKDFKILKVFIRCSDSEKKTARIVSDYGIPASNAENIRKRFDNRRAKYYYANTTKKWEDMKNYDMILDSATLGIDGCVAALKGLIE